MSLSSGRTLSKEHTGATPRHKCYPAGLSVFTNPACLSFFRPTHHIAWEIVNSRHQLRSDLVLSSVPLFPPDPATTSPPTFPTHLPQPQPAPIRFQSDSHGRSIPFPDLTGPSLSVLDCREGPSPTLTYPLTIPQVLAYQGYPTPSSHAAASWWERLLRHEARTFASLPPPASTLSDVVRRFPSPLAPHPPGSHQLPMRP